MTSTRSSWHKSFTRTTRNFAISAFGNNSQMNYKNLLSVYLWASICYGNFSFMTLTDLSEHESSMAWGNIFRVFTFFALSFTEILRVTSTNWRRVCACALETNEWKFCEKNCCGNTDEKPKEIRKTEINALHRRWKTKAHRRYVRA